MEISPEFQEVSIAILEELVKTTADFKKLPPDIYFYNLQLKEPEKYNKLDFDTNGHLPHSKNLNKLFSEFIKGGLINYDMTPIVEPIKKYINSKK